MAIISTNPLHPLYEIFAKGIYGYFLGDPTKSVVIAQLTAQGYSINKVFDDSVTGFQALGLVYKDGTRPPVLVSQGSFGPLDAIDDVNPLGVGHNQFNANKADVKAWLTSITTDIVKNPKGLKVDFTGHSLGGALTQWFASEFPDLLREAVTFQSPGITQAASDNFTSKSGKPIQISHYVVNGDLISLTGTAFLPGTLHLVDYQTPEYDPIKYFNKHYSGIFTQNLLPGFSEIATSELPTTLDTLNQSTFSYTGQDWKDFADIVKQKNPSLGAAVDSRSGAEILRKSAASFDIIIGQINNIIASNSFFNGLNSLGLSIKAVSQKSTSKINQLALFAVDDVGGKIGNLDPSTPSYLAAAIDRAIPIFSTLNGEFFSNTNQQISLNPTKLYQFIEIKDSSISDLKYQITKGNTPASVLYAFGPTGSNLVKVTENTAKNGYQVSIDNDELVLDVLKLGTLATPAIGSKSQTLPEGRTIDLTAQTGQTLKLDITTKSSAVYDNNIGFYAVEDALGTIKLADGSLITTDNSRYAVEAVKKAIANALLTANKTDSKVGVNIQGGINYAPVAIAKGTLSDFVTANTNGGDENAIHAYFNYLDANPDQIDHFRLLGSNSFGVEDLYKGGDKDFNDIVINFSIKSAIAGSG